MNYDQKLRELNDHLRNICIDQKIDYQELARKCGGSRFNYSTWLSGNYQFQPKKLNSIADKIGVKIKFEIVK